MLLEKKAILQHQAKPLPTVLLQYIYQCLLLLCFLVRIFIPAYFIGSLADHVEMQNTSSSEVSQRGCHTRNKDSFLFSICSVRSWQCSSPGSLRSLQPHSTRLADYTLPLDFCLNAWVCRTKIQDTGPTNILPSSQFPLSHTSSASEYDVHLKWRGEGNSHLVSVHTVLS